jgi:hypothetical protein
MKRLPGCEYINPYNTAILRLWNANMDIQMVGSAFGAAKYVCSYICKPECDEVNQSVREAVSNLPSEAGRFLYLSNAFEQNIFVFSSSNSCS